MKKRDESPSGPGESRDKRWTKRIQAGDHDAFRELFFSYADDLCAFAAQHVDEEETAEDIVQKVFCDLWRRRETWCPEGRTEAYLYSAVRNKALDHLDHRQVCRKYRADKKRKRQHERTGAEGRPLRDLQSREFRRMVNLAVESLPERRGLIYCMVRRHGMSYAEVSDSLDIAPKTVENQMGRALKTLRDWLKEYSTGICGY